jgi:solute carrier family 35, member E3
MSCEDAACAESANTAQLPSRQSSTILGAAGQEGFVKRWWMVPMCVTLNIFCSIGIMFANKVIFNVYELKFSTLLTCFHYITTFGVLWVLRNVFHVFEPKPLRRRHVIPLAATSILFVVFSNLSLALNGPHFYQMTRVLTSPCIFFIQMVFYGAQANKQVLALVGLTLVGASVAVFTTDAAVSTRGVGVAMLAVAATSLHQVWVGSKQRDLDCNAWQLLYYQSPISAVILLPFVPVLDQLSKLHYLLHPPEGAIIAMVSSCGLAFVLNITLFLIVGRTSPLLYSALGHIKLVMLAAIM